MRHLIVPFVILCIATTGCKIFRPTRIKTDKEYLGVKDYAGAENQKYIIIHGIGTQEDDYSIKMIERISSYSFEQSYSSHYYCYNGSKFVSVNRNNLEEDIKLNVPKDDIHLLKIVDSSDTKINTYYSINWSVLAIDKKSQFNEEEFKEFSPKFFGINKLLLKKVVMMEKVSDAFNGSEPATLSKIISIVSLIIEDGNFNNEKNINLISGSFGSQIFLGAMVALRNSDKLSMISSFEVQSFVNDPTKKLNMFLLTNQINLMDENISGWFSQIDSSELKLLEYSKVQIVAYRNPNDILCYYLPENVAEKLFSSKINPDSIDVINAYYFNWPIRNDVMTAHTSVFKLKKLSKAIYYGMDSWGVKLKH